MLRPRCFAAFALISKVKNGPTCSLSRRPLPISFQLGQQYLLKILGHGEASNHFRPKLNRWRGKQVLRQRHEVKIVVEMVSKPAMLGMACNTWMAFAITADTTKVTSG